MPIAEHIIMDEEDARAALVAENKQLKEKLAKYYREGKFSKKDTREINLQRMRVEGYVERLMK